MSASALPRLRPRRSTTCRASSPPTFRRWRTRRLERKRVREGELKVELVVDELPYEAGIDPYNKLIDRVPADNRKRVELR